MSFNFCDVDVSPISERKPSLNHEKQKPCDFCPLPGVSCRWLNCTPRAEDEIA